MCNVCSLKKGSVPFTVSLKYTQPVESSSTQSYTLTAVTLVQHKIKECGSQQHGVVNQLPSTELEWGVYWTLFSHTRCGKGLMRGGIRGGERHIAPQW